MIEEKYSEGDIQENLKKQIVKVERSVREEATTKAQGKCNKRT